MEIDRDINKKTIQLAQPPDVADGHLCISPRKRSRIIPEGVMKSVHDHLLAELQCSAIQGFPHTDHDRKVMGMEKYLDKFSQKSKNLTDVSKPPPNKLKKKCDENDCRVISRDHTGQLGPVDLKNPMYQVPLNRGWKRELVRRLDGKSSDVYYYPPRNESIGGSSRKGDKWGPKCRSYVDLDLFLESHKDEQLALSNFIFAKRLLGCNDTEKECVRQAAVKVKRQKNTEQLKRETRSQRSVRSPRMNSRATTVGKAADDEFDKRNRPIKNQTTRKCSKSTLKRKTLPKVLPCIGVKACITSQGILTEESMSEQLLLFGSPQNLPDTVGCQKGVSTISQQNLRGSSSSIVEEITVEPDVIVADGEEQPKIELSNDKVLTDFDEGCPEGVYEIKVFLKERDAAVDKIKIRRFSIKPDATPIYPHFCECLQSIFPNLIGVSFTIEWEDSEGDKIEVTSCPELKEALRLMKKIKKFYITVSNSHVTHDSKTTS